MPSVATRSRPGFMDVTLAGKSKKEVHACRKRIRPTRGSIAGRSSWWVMQNRPCTTAKTLSDADSPFLTIIAGLGQPRIAKRAKFLTEYFVYLAELLLAKELSGV